jgi:hypothetical protein
VKAAQAAGQPVISVDTKKVDTKKKELIGNFRNSGSDYRPKGCPIDVNMHGTGRNYGQSHGPADEQ